MLRPVSSEKVTYSRPSLLMELSNVKRYRSNFDCLFVALWTWASWKQICRRGYVRRVLTPPRSTSTRACRRSRHISKHKRPLHARTDTRLLSCYHSWETKGSLYVSVRTVMTFLLFVLGSFKSNGSCWLFTMINISTLDVETITIDFFLYIMSTPVRRKITWLDLF